MQIKIANMDRDAATGGVKVAHWIALKTEEDNGQTYTASSYGTVGFNPDPQDPGFVAFEDLTEAQVVTWVKTALGEETLAAMQTALTENIARQKNPPVLSGLPW